VPSERARCSLGSANSAPRQPLTKSYNLDYAVRALLGRSVINKVRYVLEDVLPAAVRDSPLFYLLLRVWYRERAPSMAQFRQRLATMTDRELVEYYRLFPALLDTTDLNQACIDRIVQEIVGEDVVDVGCGRGWLLDYLSGNTTGKRLTGVDFMIPKSLRSKFPDLSFVEGAIEELPFADGAFDTVICSHTLEHVRNVERAVSELRRVCRKRLIIVVPSEREYKYSFNLHVSFFPYPHSLLNRLAPLPTHHDCAVLDGDIFYLENMARTVV
jgi:SAM-dependent methyltransferase